MMEKIVHKITFNYINKLKDEYHPIKRNSHLLLEMNQVLSLQDLIRKATTNDVLQDLLIACFEKVAKQFSNVKQMPLNLRKELQHRVLSLSLLKVKNNEISFVEYSLTDIVHKMKQQKVFKKTKENDTGIHMPIYSNFATPVFSTGNT